MRLDTFITERNPDWRELELLLREAKRRPERLGPERLLRLGALYRAAAADLAQLRRHAPRAPETVRLEALVRQGRQAVYDVRTRRSSIVGFFATDYWRLIVERRKALLVAFVLLFGPAALAALWAVHDPAAATGVVPGQFRPALQPGHPWHDMTAPQQAAFTTEIFTNNIQVTLVAFAGGVTGGIATALALLYNGLLVGVIGGLMGQAGNGVGFVDLVTAHGVLELSCILIGGTAGLSLGWSIDRPRPALAPRLLSARGAEGAAPRGRDGALAHRRGHRRREPGKPGGVRPRRGDRNRRRPRPRLLGARPLERARQSRAIHFARRYVLTQAAASVAGAASTTVAPACCRRAAARARAARTSSATAAR